MKTFIEKLRIIYALIVCEQYAFYSIRHSRKIGNTSIFLGDVCYTSDNASKIFLEAVIETTEIIIKKQEEIK